MPLCGAELCGEATVFCASMKTVRKVVSGGARLTSMFAKPAWLGSSSLITSCTSLIVAKMTGRLVVTAPRKCGGGPVARCIS